MALFEWNDSLCTGIEQIDQQHKGLVDLINRLHTAMRTGKGNDIMDDLFAELVNYTQTHFSDEEKLMKAYNYPGLLSHQAKHKDFVDQVLEMREKAKKSKFGISIEIMTFLKDWLVNHISGTDQKYAPFLKDKGVK